ncbi:MAG: permease-like cell division protein FtsX [Muribaculaceae bacterium]|nr:permease-like cell division protein FtsX [Muribaculaceae bacterium]
MKKQRGRRISTLGSRMTSLVSVGLVLLLLGLAAVGAVAAHRLENEVRSAMGFVLVMSPDCEARDVNTVKSALMSNVGVESFAFTDADEILAAESAAMGRDIAAELDGNPYSSEFEVRVRPRWSMPDSIDAMAEFMADLPGVAEALTESNIIRNVDTSIRRVALLLAAVGAVLLFVAIALIANTVSLSVYGRRFIIHTMKLVGATASYIRRPFITAGLTGGLLAGLAASAVLIALRYYAPSEYPLVEEVIDWTETIYICIGMCIFGALLMSLTCAVAANRYIKSSYDDMFLK